MVETLALAIEVEGDGHALGAIAEVVAAAEARITWISILDAQKAVETILVELAGARNREALIDSLRSVPGVRGVAERLTLHNIFGKRIVVIGGGSQVGQVVLGAVSEADRHNLRGERISIDTIPLVGEEIIAEAVRATARLPRVEGVVLAGALMGGEIEEAVREVRAKGLLVQHGRIGAGCRRLGCDRSGAGRCHGGDGRSAYRAIRHSTNRGPALLSGAAAPQAP